MCSSRLRGVYRYAAHTVACLSILRCTTTRAVTGVPVVPSKVNRGREPRCRRARSAEPRRGHTLGCPDTKTFLPVSLSRESPVVDPRQGSPRLYRRSPYGYYREHRRLIDVPSRNDARVYPHSRRRLVDALGRTYQTHTACPMQHRPKRRACATPANRRTRTGAAAHAAHPRRLTREPRSTGARRSPFPMKNCVRTVADYVGEQKWARSHVAKFVWEMRCPSGRGECRSSRQ